MKQWLIALAVSLVGGLLAPLALFVVPRERTDPVVIVVPQDAHALAGAGAEKTASYPLADVPGPATEIADGSVIPTSWECNNATTTPVFRVSKGATAVTNGIGPYCSSCALGPLLKVPVQKVYLLASGGTPSVQCGRVDAGASYASSGGLSIGSASSTFLKIDASNEGASTTWPATSWTFPSDMAVTAGGGVNGFSVDGTTFSVDATNNRIGIGTAAPAGNLDVVGTGTVISRAMSSSGNGVSVVSATNDNNGEADLNAFGSSFGSTFLGSPLAGMVRLLLFCPGAVCAIGTNQATPIVLGTNDAEAFRITTASNLSLTRQMFIHAGTAALPSIALASDGTSGFYEFAGHTLGISTNAVSRWEINATGLIPTATESIGASGAAVAAIFADVVTGDTQTEVSTAGTVHVTYRDSDRGSRFQVANAGSTFPYVRLPGNVTTGTLPTKPACTTSVDLGKLINVDKTNDATAGDVCVCVLAADGTTFGYKSLLHNTAGVADACSY